MKIRLTNDGGYDGMDYVDFPVVVEGRVEYGRVWVTTAEMLRVGFDDDTYGEWLFLLGEDCEIMKYES